MNTAPGIAAIGLLGVFINGPANAQTTTLTEDQKLLSSAGQAFEGFGADVAADGDVAVVGGCGSADPESAYVFRHNGNVWVEEQVLNSSRPDPNEGYACDVDVCGDVIVVGAPGDPLTGRPRASAYVYRFDGSTWQEEQRLWSSDAQTSAFGADVAVHGNVIVVGATWQNSPCGGSGWTCGAAYIYRFDGTTWIQEQMIFPSDIETGDRFGDSVDVSGDTIVVGAHFEDGPGIDHGAAYVFSFDGTVWNEDQKLVASDAHLFDYFGEVVAIDGDVVAVGAPKDTLISGAVYVFLRQAGVWSESTRLVPRIAVDGNYFGFELDLKGDLLLVGAVGEGPGGTLTGEGAGYLYRFDGNSWVETRQLVASDSAQDDWLGGSAALAGSLGVIGAYGNDDSGDFSGSAYSFDLNVLSLDIDPRDLPVGTTVSIRTSGGASGMPAFLFLVDVGGVPTFQVVAGPGFFDAEGLWTLNGTVVAAPPTTTATFRALGLDAASVLIASNDASVRFP